MRNTPLKAFTNNDKKKKETKNKDDNFMKNYRWLKQTKQIPPVTKDNIHHFKQAIHDTKEKHCEKKPKNITKNKRRS